MSVGQFVANMVVMNVALFGKPFAIGYGIVAYLRGLHFLGFSTRATIKIIQNMKLEMITGCTADYLGADGVAEVDMTDEQRINTWRYIIFKLGLTDPKGDDLSKLMEFCLHQWGEWDYGTKPCDCCGDTVDSVFWEI